MKISKIRKIALYLFFFSINFEVWDPFNTGGFFSVSKLTGFIYFLTVLSGIKQFLMVRNIKTVLTPVWLFFFLLTAISLIHINYQSTSFFDFSIFQNIILLWILINHERKEPDILSKGLLSFALGSVVLSLLYYAQIGIAYEEGRVSLFGDNENTVGMRMSISVMILLINILQNPLQMNKLRFLGIAAIPVMLRLMAETGSRVAFISFVLMFFVWIVLYKPRKRWYKPIILASGILVFVYIIKYLLNTEVLMVRLLKTAEKGDFAGRDVIWQKLIPLVRENPIFGVGKTGYAEYIQIIFGGVKSPHNVIIEVLCYTGIVGLLLYFSFIYCSLKMSWKAYKSERLLLPILLFIPVAGYLLSGQILTNKMGWVIFAYAVAVGAFIKVVPTQHSRL